MAQRYVFQEDLKLQDRLVNATVRLDTATGQVKIQTDASLLDKAIRDERALAGFEVNKFDREVPRVGAQRWWERFWPSTRDDQNNFSYDYDMSTKVRGWLD